MRALLRKMTGIRKAELDERSAEGDGWSDDNPYAGATPLYIAVCAEEDGGEDTLEVLQLLIENGVDLNRPNLRGETPLSRAASLAHLGAVEKLLDAGAITEVPSPFTGLAPIFTNHEEVAKLLLKYGASCDWRDYSPEGGGSGHSFGKKPLNWWVRSKRSSHPNTGRSHAIPTLTITLTFRALENQHDEVAALLMEADVAGAERPPDLRGYKQERVEARVGRPLDPNKPLFGSGGSDSPGAGVVFSALGLPKGMSISAATGVISGVCLVEGENNLAVTVQNAHGKRVVRVRVIAEPRDAFTYAGQPFDQGGVLYHLATNGGASPWTNPSEKGRVKVEWSAPGDGAAPGTSPMEAHLVSRPDHDGSGGDSAPGPSFTMARPTGAEDAGCWMRLDLGATRRLELTNYCLRHAGAPKPVTFVDWEASKRNRYALRTWELQGAMESAGPWTTLRKHVKDQSLESASYSMVGRSDTSRANQCSAVTPTASPSPSPSPSRSGRLGDPCRNGRPACQAHGVPLLSARALRAQRSWRHGRPG